MMARKMQNNLSIVLRNRAKYLALVFVTLGSKVSYSSETTQAQKSTAPPSSQHINPNFTAERRALLGEHADQPPIFIPDVETEEDRTFFELASKIRTLQPKIREQCNYLEIKCRKMTDNEYNNYVNGLNALGEEYNSLLDQIAPLFEDSLPEKFEPFPYRKVRSTSSNSFWSLFTRTDETKGPLAPPPPQVPNFTAERTALLGQTNNQLVDNLNPSYSAMQIEPLKKYKTISLRDSTIPPSIWPWIMLASGAALTYRYFIQKWPDNPSTVEKIKKDLKWLKNLPTRLLTPTKPTITPAKATNEQ